MTEREGAGVSEELVYRISTMEEWELMQKTGSTFGGDLDRTTGFIHLSKLDQVTLPLVYLSLFSLLHPLINTKSECLAAHLFRLFSYSTGHSAHRGDKTADRDTEPSNNISFNNLLCKLYAI